MTICPSCQRMSSLTVGFKICVYLDRYSKFQRFGSDIAHVLHVKAGGCGSSANQCTAHVWKWRHVLVNMKAPILIFLGNYLPKNNYENRRTGWVRIASFFFGVRIRLGTILGRFSIIYFRGLGLRIRVRVWVMVRARVRVWVRVRIGVRVSVVLWSW